MPKITLYHGTAHDFPVFDSNFRQRGTEPNSCLGIHLTECPATAAGYAELATRDGGAGEARVLVVEADVDRVALVTSVSDFMGRDGEDPLEFSRPATDFVDAHFRLTGEGYDAIAVDVADDDLVGAWVVLNPDRLRIVGRLTVDEAYEADRDSLPDIAYTMVRLLEAEDPAPAF